MQMSRRLPLSGAHLSAHLQQLVEPQGLNLTAPHLADALKAACMRVFESRAEARAFLDSVRRASAALHLLLFPWDAPLAVALQLLQCLWGGCRRLWLLLCAWLSGNLHPQRLLPCSVVVALTSEQPAHWCTGLDSHPVCGLWSAAPSSRRLPCKLAVAGCLLEHAHLLAANCAASSVT